MADRVEGAVTRPLVEHPLKSYFSLILEKARPFLVIASCIALWEIVARMEVFPAFILPRFSSVVGSLYQTLLSGELLQATLMSIARVAAGFALGALLGIPLGLFIGWSKIIEGLINPVVETLRPIPPLAWIPLSVIWLGVGIKSVVFITLLGAFFPIVINTIHGVKSVDRKVIEFAQAMGASTRQILHKVVIPSTMPFTFVGMRLAIGFGWMCVVAAEMISVKYGLGYMIWKARYSLDTELVIGGMAAIGVLSVVMTTGMLRLEEILFRWRRGIIKG